MDEFGCDYGCRTVDESITKYNIPNDWCAEFDAYDDIYPIVCIQVDQIRKTPTMMDLKLRIVENENDEYAGCMVLKDRKTIAFKVDYMSDLLKAMGTEYIDRAVTARCLARFLPHRRRPVAVPVLPQNISLNCRGDYQLPAGRCASIDPYALTVESGGLRL